MRIPTISEKKIAPPPAASQDPSGRALQNAARREDRIVSRTESTAGAVTGFSGARMGGAMMGSGAIGGDATGGGSMGGGSTATSMDGDSAGGDSTVTSTGGDSAGDDSTGGDFAGAAGGGSGGAAASAGACSSLGFDASVGGGAGASEPQPLSTSSAFALSGGGAASSSRSVPDDAMRAHLRLDASLEERCLLGLLQEQEGSLLVRDHDVEQIVVVSVRRDNLRPDPG
jgi:hypothetical protein